MTLAHGPTKPFDYVGVDVLICMDFEATCDEGPDAQVTRDKQEIIEFPYVVVDVHTRDIIHAEQQFIKPEYSPVTKFCTELTGIEASTLEKGCTLAHAVTTFIKYVDTQIVGKNKTFALVTHGTWDLLLQLRCECATKKIDLPDWIFRFLDLRTVYTYWGNASAANCSVGSTSLRAMCNNLNITIHGRLHSGLDDSKTIAHVMLAICDLKHPLKSPSLFPNTYDWFAECAEFEMKKRTLLRIESMPYNCTKQEVLAWLTNHGITEDDIFDLKRFMYPHNLLSTGAAYLIFKTSATAMRLLMAPLIPLGDMSVFIRPMNDFRISTEQVLGRPSQSLVAAASSNQPAQGSIVWLTFKTGSEPITEALISFPPVIDSYRGTDVWMSNIYWHATRRDIESWCASVAGARPISLSFNYDSKSGKFNGTCIIKFRTSEEARATFTKAARAHTICNREPSVRAMCADERIFASRIGRWEEVASMLEVECDGIHSDMRDEHLLEFFSQWGPVRQVVHYTNPETCQGSGRVSTVSWCVHSPLSAASRGT